MNAKTETEAKVDQPLMGSTPLAVVKPGTITNITEIVWTQERIDLIKRMKCPADTTDDEFAIFLAQCKRTGMDPLIDEADCVPRWVNTKVRQQNGSFIEKYVERKCFQPREAGMRARADRFDDYRGISYGVVREGDVFEFEPSAFRVKHVCNPADPARGKKPIMGAWAQITRAGRLCVPIWIPLSERVQHKRDGGITQMWDLKTEGMIGKCARAEALRIEYPNVWSGLYISEEWEHDEREINAAPNDAKPAGTKTEQVLQHVQAKVDQLKKTQPEDAQVVQAPAPVPAAATTDTKPDPKPSPPKDTKKKDDPNVFDGKKIVDLNATELALAIEKTKAWLAEHPMGKAAPMMRAKLDTMEKEQVGRVATSLPPREPGQDDDEDADAPF